MGLMGLMDLMVISWWFNGIYNLVDLLGGGVEADNGYNHGT